MLKYEKSPNHDIYDHIKIEITQICTIDFDQVKM